MKLLVEEKWWCESKASTLKPTNTSMIEAKMYIYIITYICNVYIGITIKLEADAIKRKFGFAQHASVQYVCVLYTF